MDGQKWPFLAVNMPSQAHRASTSGKNTESFVFFGKNWQFLAIMTWLLASKMMRCIAKSAFKWIPVVIFHFASRSGLLLKCFVSYTQMHKVGILPFITRSNRQNYAMCVVSPCSYTFQVLLETDFYSLFINRCFSDRKTDFSHMTLSYLPPLRWLQIGFVGHPCCSPNSSWQ